MDGLKAVESVYVAGQWRDATWLAEVVDPETGALVLTATVDGPDGGSAPVVCALRLTQELMRGLRESAGLDGALPSEQAAEARAELAYWRESVEFAVKLLAGGRAAGQNIVTQSGHAEEYLRGLLALDGADKADGADAPCYDCRTTGERLAVQEDRLQILSDTMRRIVAEIDQRLDALEAAATPAIANREWMTATEGVLNQIEARLVALDAHQRGQLYGHKCPACSGGA